MSRNLVSTTFKVSHSTIKRWLARRGSGQPLSTPRPSGRTPIFSDSDLTALHSRLQAADAAHPSRGHSPLVVARLRQNSQPPRRQEAPLPAFVQGEVSPTLADLSSKPTQAYFKLQSYTVRRQQRTEW
jgi:hypothetical protein